MIRSTAAIAIFLAISASASEAAEVPGRFILERVEDGYLRLDRESGAVSHCTAAAGGQWECRAVKDESAALTAENVRLRRENEELRKQIANSYAITLPDEQDFARLRSILGNIADRFRDFVNGLAG